MIRRVVLDLIFLTLSFVVTSVIVFTLFSEPPAAPQSVVGPVSLSAQHDCWTGEAPADVEFPGHVVVFAGGEEMYGGPELVSLALDQQFGAGVDYGFDVLAFCR